MYIVDCSLLCVFTCLPNIAGSVWKPFKYLKTWFVRNIANALWRRFEVDGYLVGCADHGALPMVDVSSA